MKLLRYAIAGVAISLGYTLTVIVLVEYVGWRNPSAANAVSFLFWTPASYLIHREFTFRFDGPALGPAMKFAATTLIKLLMSIAVVEAATRAFGAHYIFGVLANWIVLPLVAFVIMKLWVFRERFAPEPAMIQK